MPQLIQHSQSLWYYCCHLLWKVGPWRGVKPFMIFKGKQHFNSQLHGSKHRWYLDLALRRKGIKKKKKEKKAPINNIRGKNKKQQKEKSVNLIFLQRLPDLSPGKQLKKLMFGFLFLCTYYCLDFIPTSATSSVIQSQTLRPWSSGILIWQGQVLYQILVSGLHTQIKNTFNSSNACSSKTEEISILKSLESG